MGGRSKKTREQIKAEQQTLRDTVKALAKERDGAVQRLTDMMDTLKVMRNQQQKLVEDAARWMTALMLRTNEHQMSFSPTDLQHTANWVLERQVDPEAKTIVWKLTPKEEYEARVAAVAKADDGVQG